MGNDKQQLVENKWKVISFKNTYVKIKQTKMGRKKQLAFLVLIFKAIELADSSSNKSLIGGTFGPLVP